MSFFSVHCFTCGKVIGKDYEYIKNISQYGISHTINDLNLKKYCCRRMIMGYVDLDKRYDKINK
jgi:DNA-directed RNA polymerase subunit N (RpoN/RPB10)